MDVKFFIRCIILELVGFLCSEFIYELTLKEMLFIEYLAWEEGGMNF